MENLNWRLKTFSALNAQELHALYHLRTAVFVVEQACAYQEVDAHDVASQHLLAYYQEGLVACARVCPPGSVYPQPSIGRVAVADAYRGKGLGRLLFSKALSACCDAHPAQEIKIQGQCYLEKFYQSFGFKTITAPYPDWGIMHVDMVWASKDKS